jgi:hypothetical protein
VQLSREAVDDSARYTWLCSERDREIPGNSSMKSRLSCVLRNRCTCAAPWVAFVDMLHKDRLGAAAPTTAPGAGLGRDAQRARRSYPLNCDLRQIAVHR